MKLTPPNSWADRKAAQLLRAAAPQNFDKTLVYLGCCLNLDGDEISRMVRLGEEVPPEKAVPMFREECSGFDKWEEVMGYVRDPKFGLTVGNDWSLSFWRGTFMGAPCRWIDHSRIEYIWINRFHYAHLVNYVTDSAGPALGGLTPAEKVRHRAARVNYATGEEE